LQKREEEEERRRIRIAIGMQEFKCLIRRVGLSPGSSKIAPVSTFV
jgi:hypothetical protein